MPTNKPFLCATAARIYPVSREIEVALENGDIYRCLLSILSERLQLVHSSLLMEWEWIGPQAGIHWPAVDEDVSVESIVANGVRCEPATEALVEVH
jgi:hypothetical protein